MADNDDSPRIGGNSSGGSGNGGMPSAPNPLKPILSTVMGGTTTTDSNGNVTYTNAKPETVAVASDVLKDRVKSKYSALAGTTLGQFNMSNYGLTFGQMDDEGNIIGNDALVYDGGTLLVKNDMINQFYSIFAAQNKSAIAKSTQFLAQDTVLSGESASKKGTVLGGMV